MKKTLLHCLLLLAAVALPWSLQAQTTLNVIIGSHSESSEFLPGFNYYNYSYTQQIWTAEEIGRAGTINSIGFKNTGAEKTRTYNIYMAHTSKESFLSTSDWVPMSESDMVFAGEVTFTVGDWTTITLTHPFEYNGSDNLIISCSDVTGNYTDSPHMTCVVSSTSSTTQALRDHRDARPYDIAAPGAGQLCNYKNYIKLNITVPPSCPAPVLTGSGITNVTNESAQISWTGNNASNSYTVRLRSVEDAIGTKEGFDEYEQEYDNVAPEGWEEKRGLLSNVMAGSALSDGDLFFGYDNSVFNSHARINIYGSDCKEWLISPEMTVPDYNGVLIFDLAITAYSGQLAPPETNGIDDKFVVLVTTDNEATWTILRQWNNTGSPYVYNDIVSSAWGERIWISLTNYAGQNVKIAFYGESTVSNADNNIHIDNVEIGTKSPVTMFPDIETEETSVTITNLNANTFYEVLVKGHCADDETSDDSRILLFKTGSVCPEELLDREATVGENGVVTFHVTQAYGSFDHYEYEYWTGDDYDHRTTGTSESDEWTLTIPGSEYHYYWNVRGYCAESEEYTDWFMGEEFLICTTIAVTEDNPFEASSHGGNMACWDFGDNGESGDDYVTWDITCPNGISYWIGNYGSNGVIRLTSPAIQLPETGGAVLSFQEIIAGAESYGLNAIILTPEGTGNPTTIWSPATVEDGTFDREISLNDYMGQTFRLVFKYSGYNAHYWGINNISVALVDPVQQITATACEEYVLTNSLGEPVETFTESGVYEYNYEDPEQGTVHVTLDLTIGHKQHSYLEVTSCGPYYWDFTDKTYNKSGLKYRTGTTEEGCPIRDTLDLTIVDRWTNHDTVTSCGSYMWNGHIYYQSGNKTFKGVDGDGCPVYDTLTLYIVDLWTRHDTVTHCGPYTWLANRKTYNKSGRKYYSGTAEDGCPIRDTLDLTIIDHYGSHERVTNCGPYTWEANGRTYNKGGVKSYSGSAEDGCPIRDTLNLTIVDKWSNHETVTSCGPYTWAVNGRTYNKSGVKTYKGTAADGCPTYDTLTLTVASDRSSHVQVNSCGPYTWAVNGKTYSKSGVKTYKGTTEEGCAQRDTLTLNIVDRITNHEVVRNCGPYTWDVNGKTYAKSGVKTYKGTSPEGCPVYDTLTLTVLESPTSHEYVTSCGAYTWPVNGKTYNKSGEKTYKGTTAEGCPKYDTLTLTVVDHYGTNTVVTNCGPYIWEANGKTYNKGGRKTYTGTAADGCPIRDTLTLTIVDKYSNHEYVTNCGPYTWAVNGRTYNQSGVKTYKGTAADGCPTYDTLTLTINNCDKSPENNSQLSTFNSQLSLYPNPTTGLVHIDVKSNSQLSTLNSQLQVEVLDLVGRRVALFENSTTLDLTGLADGTYTLRITTPEGVAIKRVVKK